MNDPASNYQAAPPSKPQELTDAENLNALTLCHYIMGGVTALFASIFIIHIVMGTMMIHNPGMFTPRPVPQAYPSAPPIAGQVSPVHPYPFFPPAMGYMFVTIGHHCRAWRLDAGRSHGVCGTVHEGSAQLPVHLDHRRLQLRLCHAARHGAGRVHIHRPAETNREGTV